MIPSRLSISIPTRLGAINSWIAPLMELFVSPVITAVGGASPNPVCPSSVVIRTITSLTLSTVRRAVLNGVTRGIRTSPVSIFAIFIVSMSFSHTVSELMPPNRQRSYKVNLHAPGGGHSTAHKSLAGTLGIPE